MNCFSRATIDLPKVKIRQRITIPRHGTTDFDLCTFDDLPDGKEHIALVFGVVPSSASTLVRLHSECLTGDVFSSGRCDCGPQLEESINALTRSGGVLLYLRQEGRGIGLYNKIDSYALQDQGLDTYAANKALGYPAEGRRFDVAAPMLAALGLSRVCLMTNNPAKAQQLEEAGITIVEQISTGVFSCEANEQYLSSKVKIGGHKLNISFGCLAKNDGERSAESEMQNDRA